MNDDVMKRYGIDENATPEAMKAAMAKYAELVDEEKKKGEEEMAAVKAAMAAEPAKPFEGKETPEEEKAEAAKMTAMSAALDGLKTEIATLRADKQSRDKAESDSREQRFAALADAAVKGGYPATGRDALIKMARVDEKAAEELAAPFTAKVATLSRSVTRGNLPNAPAAGPDVKVGRATIAFGQGLANAIRMHREKNPGLSYEKAADAVAKSNPELVDSYHAGGAQ